MTTVIIDKANGIVLITLTPPIDVEFKELPQSVYVLPSNGSEEPIIPLPIEAPVEKPTPILMQKPFKFKEYPKPDEKLLKKGEYITSTQAATIIGVTRRNFDFLANQERIKVYRKEPTSHLLFLLRDVVAYIKSKKL